MQPLYLVHNMVHQWYNETLAAVVVRFLSTL